MNIIEQHLQDSAWYEGRNIDISFIDGDLLQVGICVMNENVANFLKEFLNVELHLPRSLHIRFNIEDVVRFLDTNLINKLNKISADILVPIGIVHEGVALLFMGYSGNFYMLYERDLTIIGNNIISALIVIINNTDF